MNNHVYEFDEVVIGTGLNAVFYSFFNSVPLVLNDGSKPFFFEFFQVNELLDKIHLEPYNFKLRGFANDKVMGAAKLPAWERIVFVLSLSGLLPSNNNVSSIRVSDSNELRVITFKDSKPIKIKFNKLRIFNDKNIFGLGTPKDENQEHLVIDWMSVKSGMVHEYDYLKTEDDFVKEIYFYPSVRFDGANKRKDAVALSFLDEEQLLNVDYSDTIARFKVTSLMKGAGIRGARNGRDPDRPGKYKFYSIKVESSQREVRPLKMNIYENTENIIFDQRTDYEVYEQLNTGKDYVHKINSLISIKEWKKIRQI